MKGSFLKDFLRAVLLQSAAALAISCSLFTIDPENPAGGGEPELSRLRISFDDCSVAETKAYAEEKIDTNSFLLDISKADGTVIYSGTFGDSPESFSLEGGSYVVRAVSAEFDKPAFASPQYGDEQCIVIPPGEEIGVKLDCNMMNCGICLSVASGFLTSYPKSRLFVSSADGRLLYSYTEKRIAYFNPGKISLVLSDDSAGETLMTRSLKPGEVLKLSVKVAAGSGSSARGGTIGIAVDTSKTWIMDSYTIGGSNSSSDSGSSDDDVLTIAKARSSIGLTDVRVGGYVVGGDLTSANASFTGPFKSRSNLLLGPRSSASSRESCLSVQLGEGDVRDALNLVDNPDMLGRYVLLRGDIVQAYYGLVGLKNVTDFELR